MTPECGFAWSPAIAGCCHGVVIRVASVEDIAALPSIERAAGSVFRQVGMAAVADDEPLGTSDLLGYQRAGRAWVATDGLDRPVAYLLLDVVDATAHIDQVSVHPDHARRGLGRGLIETAAAWAGVRRMSAVTLTTFRDVPWNAPYYGRLGFSVIPRASLSAGLRRIRAQEAAHGLDVWPRVAMRRRVDAAYSTVG